MHWTYQREDMVNDNVMLSEYSQSEGNKLSSCTCAHDFKFLSTTGGVYFGKGGICIHIKGMLKKKIILSNHNCNCEVLTSNAYPTKNKSSSQSMPEGCTHSHRVCFTKCQDITGIRIMERGAQKLDEIFKLCPNLAILYKRHQYKLLESCNSYCIQGCCRSCNCLLEIEIQVSISVFPF